MFNKEFSVIGGDKRSLHLANLFLEEENKVSTYGFGNTEFKSGIYKADNLSSAINNSDVVVGPVPCSNDNENLNAPFHPNKIKINEIFKTMSKNQLFVAGRISEKIAHMSKVYNVYTADLLKREEMAVLNAIPTAEGAVKIALSEMPITLHKSNSLILGFGRIGKMLAKMLYGIGANVYVEARKYSDIAWINSYNYKPVFIKDLNEYLSNMDVIFNTIPHVILDYDKLNKIDRECLIIDLASKPGGVDFDKASELGLKTIWALSLPGKVAPVTAAEFIKNTIYNILIELGV